MGPGDYDARSDRGPFAFLARAGALLDASLDFGITLASVAHLAVPELADYCLVDVVDEAGRMQRVATAHRDPTLEPLLRSTEQRHLANADHPATRALETGKPVLQTGLTPTTWESIAKDAEHLEVLRKLRPHSWMFVPMVARNKPIGTIALVLSEPDRVFSPDDIALAQEIGRRAGLAVDNARLYQRAESQRARLYSLFMKAPAAIAITRGPEHLYELSNPMNRRLVGGRDLVGKTVKEGLPEFQDQGLIDLLDHVYRSAETFRGSEVPVTVKDDDGTDRQLFVNGIYEPLVGEGRQVEGIMAFAYDVTAQVVARRKVEELAVELEKAVHMRDEFLSIAGHELRTPLTALKLQLDGLHRQAERGALPTERLVERLAKSIAHVNRLERLIAELLDVSRIAAGRVGSTFEELDLSLLVREVVDRFAEESERVGSAITIVQTDEVPGRWDRMGLDQVITNLVGNAVKYGAGKPIEVSLSATPTKASLKVTDHGIGIAPTDHDRLFGRFERAVSDRNYGGLGLGLWIAKQLVDAHGGTISFTSALNEGTSFVVELPRRLTP